MGDLRDYDNLCEALEAYEATDVELHTLFPYLTLKRAAQRCGIDTSVPFLAASRRRVQTYRNHLDTLEHAVSRIQSQIDALPASDAMCGGKS